MIDELIYDLHAWVARNKTTAYSILGLLVFLVFVAPLMGGVGYQTFSAHIGVPILSLDWFWLIPGGIVWCIVALLLWRAGAWRHRRIVSLNVQRRFCRGCDYPLPAGANYCIECRTPVTAFMERL